MAFEIEMKFHCPTDRFPELVTRLLEIGARDLGEKVQVDRYLRHPARDFAVTNEAFRIRKIGNDQELTYKGPRSAGITKTREEIVVGLESGDRAWQDAVALFDRLGFLEAATLRKQRRDFRISFPEGELTISLDVADGLGGFVEVEAIAEKSDGIAALQKRVTEFSADLGLTELETRSYLRMYLESVASLVLPPLDEGGD